MPEPSTAELVYVLGTPGSYMVKIGRTTNLERRLADIQRMSPVPLAVLWTHPGGNELEANLHRHFKALRSHGEWFTFRRDPVTLIRWAVEDQPWLQPKVSLARAPGVPDAARTPIRGARTPSTPRYVAIAEHIRRQVVSGCIAPGFKTPALHSYADEFGVCYETVKRACDELASRGVLAHGSSGYRVPRSPRPALPHDWYREYGLPG